MFKIAIIVLHFGDKKNTLECLTYIKNSDYPNNLLSVYVIDNGTGELSKKELKNKFYFAKLISLTYNSGFSEGVNAGIISALKDSSVKYILLLNNDLVIEPSSLKLLSNQYENENIDIAGGVINYYDRKNKIWFAGGYLDKIFCFTRHPYMNRQYNPALPIAKSDFITGAFMFIRREVFKKIGLFDSDYFLYWEDVDFCLRARKAKFKISCLNSIIAHHKISSSSGLRGTNRLTPLKAYYLARNSFLFMKKNNLPLVTGLLGQLFIRLPFYFFSLTGARSLSQYLRGIKDGVRYLYSP